MKQSVKNYFKDLLFKVYEPYAIRKEKMKATRMWHQGVRMCEKMCKELNGPRVYLFFDAKHNVWAPMTYEPNKKYKPSYKMLRVMGKMKGLVRIHGVDDMKKFSYYYTPSRWGALGCREDNRIRQEKLELWLNYYMQKLSEPMRKCQAYRQRRAKYQRRQG
ncbi:MAG: hypothetical protein IJQ13_04635 [Prevotella sp.]|nr:hypothetical protein [Prevotella sp.]